MEGKQTIHQAITKADLIAAFHHLGIHSGMILEVHSSLSSLGYVVGGARTVVDALMETVGENGTILMPIQTGENSDPSGWVNPPIDPELWDVVRKETPAYHPEKTDLRLMGAISENFRHRQGIVFSGHPTVSYAAWGQYAHLLCNRQSLHFPLAEESPTARLYEVRGSVLMIGTDYDTSTCMHLAEYRMDAKPIKVQYAAMEQDGQKEWRAYLDLDLDSSVFPKVGEEMERNGMVRQTMLGNCALRLFSAVDAVDTAVRYYEKTTVYDLYR